MMLSTRGRYGLKAMVDLAQAYGKTRLSTMSLAALQGVSGTYLEQLISALKKAGLVNATRGAQGGYELSRAPEEITINEVLNALEGETIVANCVSTGNVNCTNACICSTRPLWLKLQNRINEVLDSTTLKDMADDYQIQLEREVNETNLS